MNFLTFISSSAAQIYEIHILVISLSIRTTVAIVLFCFVLFLRPSNFFGPSGRGHKYEKERGYKYVLVHVLQGTFFILYIMAFNHVYVRRIHHKS